MNARMIIWVIDCFIIQQGRASFKPFVSFAAYVKYERSYSSSTKTTPSSLTTRESNPDPNPNPLYSPLHAHGDRRHSSVTAMYYPTTDREWMKKPSHTPSLSWAVQNVKLHFVWPVNCVPFDVVPLPLLPLSFGQFKLLNSMLCALWTA